jgi:hypothetical protein
MVWQLGKKRENDPASGVMSVCRKMKEEIMSTPLLPAWLG